MSPLRSPGRPQLGDVTLVSVEQPGGHRSLALRLVPWLIPIGLILLGLVFVAAGLDGSDEPPAGDHAPATVSTVFEDNAQAWALGQVGTGVTTEVTDVVMVNAIASGSIYTSKAVIIRVDSRILPPGDPSVTLSEADSSTVATCVLWDVDVSAGTFVEKAAEEIWRATGRHEIDDTDELRIQCEQLSLGG